MKAPQITQSSYKDNKVQLLQIGSRHYNQVSLHLPRNQHDHQRNYHTYQDHQPELHVEFVDSDQVQRMSSNHMRLVDLDKI